MIALTLRKSVPARDVIDSEIADYGTILRWAPVSDLLLLWHAVDVVRIETASYDFGVFRTAVEVSMMDFRKLAATTNVLLGIERGREVVGLSGKGIRTVHVVIIICSTLVLVGIAWFLSLPEALNRETFLTKLRAELESNLAGVECRTSVIKARLKSAEQRLGPIEKLIRVERVGSPRATFPTLQADVVVRRRKNAYHESYTFITNEIGDLVIVGFTGDSDADAR